MSPSRRPRQRSDEVNEQDMHLNRKRFFPQEKFKIVKEHLTMRTPISELSKRYGMTPQSFNGWQEQFFDAALAGFDRKRGPKEQINKNDRRVEELEADNNRMRDVIAEITAENVAFKKKSLPYLR
jgi:transposase-like protein